MRGTQARSWPETGFVFALWMLLALVLVVAAPVPASATLPGGYYSVWRGPNTHGAFAWPSGVAVDAEGSLFVADTQNHRILKLGPGGSVLEAWGSEGSAPGQFQRPTGVAIGLDGRIHVTDTDNHRIQVFSPTGSLVDIWTAGGTLSGPTGIAVDGVGALYVSDTRNHRILRFTADGRNHTPIGGPGPGNGQFSSPVGIAVDATHLYVADSNNRRIQRLTLAGGYVSQWGQHEIAGHTHSRYGAVYGIAVTGEDTLVVVDMAGIRNPPPNAPVRHIERSTKTGDSSVQWGPVGDGPGQYRIASGVVARPGGGVYIADTGNDRIQVLDSTWSTTEVWDLSGSGPGQLNSPVAVASAPDGSIYVVDEGNARIQVFDANRAFVRTFGGSGLTTQPTDVAVAANGDVLVAVSGGIPRVDRFSATGDLLGSIGAGELSSSQGIAIAPSGDIWVADAVGVRVRRFSESGVLLQTLQPPSGDPGALMAPVDVAVDASGRLWVVDRDAARVLVFDGAGAFLFALGGFGEMPGLFRAPNGITVGLSGQIYVSDTANGRVQRFSPSGIFQEVFGSLGSGEGQLRGPMRPAVLPNGNLIVPERDNHRLQIFEYDVAPPVTTASGFPVGWTNQPVTLTLSATDASSGVGTTYFRVPGGSVEVYTGPFVIDRDMDAVVRWWSVDKVGNIEAENFRRVRIDRTPPSGTFDINGGARFTTTSTVTLNSTIVSGHMMRFDVGSGVGQWGPLWPALDVTLPGEGHRIVRTEYGDAAGNILSLVSSITADWTPPSTVASGLTDAWVRGPVSVSLVAMDNVSGVASTRIRVGATGSFSEYIPDDVVTISGEGETVLEWYSVDSAGNREATKTATVRIDDTPPSGTFNINGGARFTTTPTVTLNSAIVGGDQMRFDVGSGFGQWESLSSALDVTLPGEGHREVRTEYNDVAGNVLSLVASISADWTPPSTVASGLTDAWVRGPVRVSLVAADNVSGVASTRVRVGATGPFSENLPGDVVTITGEGETVLEWYSVDSAGNREATKTATVRIDNTPPPGTFVLAGGATYIATGTVEAFGSAPGSTEMRYTSGSMDTGWIAFESRVQLVLDGPGTHLVTGRFRDSSGNEAVHESSVTVDLEAPTTAVHGGFNGFRARPATLTLEAVDDRSGVSATFYRVGSDGPARPYTAPIIVDKPGVTEVNFWSVDWAGNIEAPRTATVGIIERVRHEGVNRYQTAIEVSRHTFSAARSVVLASGEDFPDALSAASLAGALEAPVLLTMRNALPDGLLAEASRLGATKVYIIGGTGAVSQAVETRIVGAGLVVERIGGRDRFHTAVRVAQATVAKRGAVAEPGLVFVARGDDFPDAVSAAAAGFGGRVPILLVRQTSVPTTTAQAIRDLGLTEAIILGGTGAIQERVLPGLGVRTQRVAGGDRYATSAAFFEFAKRRSLVGSATVGLVTGERFPDALAGGAAIGYRDGAMLLTRPNSLPVPARDRLLASAGVVERITVIGGQGAVAEGVVNAAMQALR